MDFTACAERSATRGLRDAAIREVIGEPCAGKPQARFERGPPTVSPCSGPAGAVGGLPVASLRLDCCSVDLASGEVRAGSDGFSLTPRERDLLRYLAERPGVDVPRDVVLREVFGYAPSAQSRAVDKTMYNLRRKVE